MNKYEIDKKQVCALLLTIVPSSKFLILPTLYASFAKQDAWFAGLLDCLLDGALLTVALVFINKYEDKTFFEVIEGRFGKTFARVVYFVYGIYFMLKCIVPVFEQKNYTEIVLYETSPTVFTFLPFFLVSTYICVKGFRNMARTGEIVVWFTVIGLTLVFFLSVSSVDLFYLRPVLKNPFFQTLSGCYRGLIWYGQPIILFFLAGKIKKGKNFSLHVALTFGITSLIVVLLFAFFTGIYGDIAVWQLYALTKMTKYSIALSNVGRFDYVATLMMVMSGVLSLSVPLVFSTECFKQAIGKGKSILYAAITNGIVMAVLVVFALYFSKTVDIFEYYLSPLMIVLVYVFPSVMVVLGRKTNGSVIEKGDLREKKETF